MKMLLIVEDDKVLREGLCFSLQSDGISAVGASCLSEAHRIFSTVKIDLIILDCNLPDGNGVVFCTEIRKSSDVPVIFLTVLDSEIDEVSAFRAGGWDYIKKPFSLMVLSERVKAALIRSNNNAEIGLENKIEIGLDNTAVSSADTIYKNGNFKYSDNNYHFDFRTMTFTVKNENIILSLSEQKLLRILIENKNNIVPRALLCEQLWSCESDYIDENALSVTVKRLRSKLGAGCIKTAYGLGYMWTGDK